MSQFFESIRVVNGRVMNLHYHQKRVNKCCKHFLINKTISLKDGINTLDIPQDGIYKLRISYDIKTEAISNYSFDKYIEKEIKNINIVMNDLITYAHKSEDRKELNLLYNERKSGDDILIIKNNIVTDTWYCNVAFFRNDKWYTPKNCLLEGTMRQKLIDRNILVEKDILLEEINTYRKMRLFNSMIPWSRKKDIKIQDVIKSK